MCIHTHARTHARTHAHIHTHSHKATLPVGTTGAHSHTLKLSKDTLSAVTHASTHGEGGGGEGGEGGGGGRREGEKGAREKNRVGGGRW